ncbi:MAG: hypothetical protein WCL11_16235 [Verrucomicrobiota bacterium]
MRSFHVLGLLVSVALFLVVPLVIAADKPNFIVINIDNLGYGDI